MSGDRDSLREALELCKRKQSSLASIIRKMEAVQATEMKVRDAYRALAKKSQTQFACPGMEHVLAMQDARQDLVVNLSNVCLTPLRSLSAQTADEWPLLYKEVSKVDQKLAAHAQRLAKSKLPSSPVLLADHQLVATDLRRAMISELAQKRDSVDALVSGVFSRLGDLLSNLSQSSAPLAQSLVDATGAAPDDGRSAATTVPTAAGEPGPGEPDLVDWRAWKETAADLQSTESKIVAMLSEGPAVSGSGGGDQSPLRSESPANVPTSVSTGQHALDHQDSLSRSSPSVMSKQQAVADSSPSQSPRLAGRGESASILKLKRGLMRVGSKMLSSTSSGVDPLDVFDQKALYVASARFDASSATELSVAVGDFVHVAPVLAQDNWVFARCVACGAVGYIPGGVTGGSGVRRPATGGGPADNMAPQSTDSPRQSPGLLELVSDTMRPPRSRCEHERDAASRARAITSEALDSRGLTAAAAAASVAKSSPRVADEGGEGDGDDKTGRSGSPSAGADGGAPSNASAAADSALSDDDEMSQHNAIMSGKLFKLKKSALSKARWEERLFAVTQAGWFVSRAHRSARRLDLKIIGSEFRLIDQDVFNQPYCFQLGRGKAAFRATSAEQLDQLIELLKKCGAVDWGQARPLAGAPAVQAGASASAGVVASATESAAAAAAAAAGGAASDTELAGPSHRRSFAGAGMTLRKKLRHFQGGRKRDKADREAHSDNRWLAGTGSNSSAGKGGKSSTRKGKTRRGTGGNNLLRALSLSGPDKGDDSRTVVGSWGSTFDDPDIFSGMEELSSDDDVEGDAGVRPAAKSDDHARRMLLLRQQLLRQQAAHDDAGADDEEDDEDEDADESHYSHEALVRVQPLADESSSDDGSYSEMIEGDFDVVSNSRITSAIFDDILYSEPLPPAKPSPAAAAAADLAGGTEEDGDDDDDDLSLSDE